MNIVLTGPQGSGKGTQAELLANKYHLIYLEMGKILRSISTSDNEHSKIVFDALNSGNLVPDEYVRLIAWDFINKHHDTHNGFIFDGYPRSVEQYDQLEDILCKFGKQIDHVILLDIPPEESVRRLTARRNCEKCGAIYNLITEPPKKLDECDKCGGKLISRLDDQPDAIRRRLQLYRESTAGVLKRAELENKLIIIDGKKSINDIFSDIVSKL